MADQVVFTPEDIAQIENYSVVDLNNLDQHISLQTQALSQLDEQIETIEESSQPDPDEIKRKRLKLEDKLKKAKKTLDILIIVIPQTQKEMDELQDINILLGKAKTDQNLLQGAWIKSQNGLAKLAIYPKANLIEKAINEAIKPDKESILFKTVDFLGLEYKDTDFPIGIYYSGVLKDFDISSPGSIDKIINVFSTEIAARSSYIEILNREASGLREFLQTENELWQFWLGDQQTVKQVIDKYKDAEKAVREQKAEIRKKLEEMRKLRLQLLAELQKREFLRKQYDAHKKSAEDKYRRKNFTEENFDEDEVRIRSEQDAKKQALEDIKRKIEELGVDKTRRIIPTETSKTVVDPGQARNTTVSPQTPAQQTIETLQQVNQGVGPTFRDAPVRYVATKLKEIFIDPWRNAGKVTKTTQTVQTAQTVVGGASKVKNLVQTVKNLKAVKDLASWGAVIAGSGGTAAILAVGMAILGGIKKLFSADFWKNTGKKLVTATAGGLILAKVIFDFLATNFIGAGIGGIAGFFIPGLGPVGSVAGALMGAQFQAILFGSGTNSGFLGIGATSINSISWSTLLSGSGVANVTFWSVGGAVGITISSIVLSIFTIIAAQASEETKPIGETEIVSFSVTKSSSVKTIALEGLDLDGEGVPVTYEYVIKNAESPIEITKVEDEIFSNNGGNKVPIQVSKPDGEIEKGKTTDKITYSVIIKNGIFGEGIIIENSVVTNQIRVTGKNKTTGKEEVRTASYSITIGNPPQIQPYGYPIAGIINSVDDQPITISGVTRAHYGFLRYPWSSLKVSGGLDIAPRNGNNTIFSTVRGTIKRAQWNNDTGGSIYVQTINNQYIVAYLHLSRATVDNWKDKVGQEMAQGIEIGVPHEGPITYVNGSGETVYASTNTHLHYQVLTKFGADYINLPFASNLGNCGSGAILPGNSGELRTGLMVPVGPTFGCATP